uniref:NADH-ubiquinone oxidoreductase chain 2 n=1 Tax=Anadara antiquata TaxID=142560 RepID=A0A516IDF7_9BIVA|nr:NADH dehydrogenase subunit 2 [Anadara antiquata]
MVYLMMDLATFIFMAMTSVESTMKYGLGMLSFVVHQSIASAFLYFSYFIFYWTNIYNEFISLLTVIGLFWKMGLPPFHGWYSSVFMEIAWFECFFLSTIMKIIPAVLLGNIVVFSGWYMLWWGMCVYAFLYSGCASAMQNLIRGFFAYSSISSSCWMVFGAAVSKEIFFFYFFVYSAMVLVMMVICKKWDVKSIVKLGNMSKSDGWLIAFSSYSLAGMPPFAGFMPKLLICCGALYGGSTVTSIVVVGFLVGAIINTAIYIDVANASMKIWNPVFTCPMMGVDSRDLSMKFSVVALFYLFHFVVAVIGMSVGLSHFYD